MFLLMALLECGMNASVPHHTPHPGNKQLCVWEFLLGSPFWGECLASGSLDAGGSGLPTQPFAPCPEVTLCSDTPGGGFAWGIGRETDDSVLGEAQQF